MGSETRAKKPTRNRPGLELLEQRVVLSTYNVVNVAELQADIALVNNKTGPNTIVLAPGTYSLTNALKIQNATNLTIRADASKGVVSLVGSNVDRVLEIDGGVVTLADLSISGGGNVAQGGGILAQNATLSLQNTRVFGNLAYQAAPVSSPPAQRSTFRIARSLPTGRETAARPWAAGLPPWTARRASPAAQSMTMRCTWRMIRQTPRCMVRGPEFTPGVGLSPLPIVT